jgi:Mg/Co/Ni transporter MgtE
MNSLKFWHRLVFGAECSFFTGAICFIILWLSGLLRDGWEATLITMLTIFIISCFASAMATYIPDILDRRE